PVVNENSVPPRPEQADDMIAWAASELSARGIAVHEAVWPHLYPWSHVAKLTTDHGDHWFKAGLGDTGYEAALLRLLGSLTPAHVVVPLAVDPARGWSLSPDGGVTLRSVESGGFEVPAWERMLREYAHLQRDLTAHVPDLLAVGVPDLRPQRLPELFDELLADPEVQAGLGDKLAPLRDRRAAYADAAARLAGSGIAPTLQHDDLHDANVLVRGDKFAFFDWGDSSVAHPFGTLLVTLRVAAHKTGAKAGDPLLARLRDAYLEPWTAERDHGELVELVGAALTVTKVSRALSYRRALIDVRGERRPEHADAIWGWLEELLEPDMW
ncbi:MAG: phosphotransferase, partial [Hamadaea sp.]|nr:phosphotransferase [Hamadaea sp.]